MNNVRDIIRYMRDLCALGFGVELKPAISPTALLDLKARLILIRRSTTMIKRADGSLFRVDSTMACSSLAMIGYLHSVGYNPFTKRTTT